MTKDQPATSAIPEELYNLTQLAEVTLAAGRLSTTNIEQIKDYMNSHQSPECANGQPAVRQAETSDGDGDVDVDVDGTRLRRTAVSASSAATAAPARCTATFYASSDDDSSYYSHKVFDRRKQRRCTISDSNSCASSSASSSGAASGEEPSSVTAKSDVDGALGLLEDEHICPECGKKYSTSSNLARHRQTHRSIMDKKARHCPYCEKVYVSMPAFSMHVRTHNQGCECQYCGKCFSRPWLLQGHIRTHTGEKPFKCSVCDKAFADKSNLRAHIQTHSNTKPHTCARCGKAFALKSYLYKHEESSCLKNRSSGDRDRERDREPRSAPRPAPASPKRQNEPPRETLQPVAADSAKSTLANKLLQKEKERRQAALAYGYPHSSSSANSSYGLLGMAPGHMTPEEYERFKRISVIQPTALPYPSAVYQEHLFRYQHPAAPAAEATAAVVAAQEQPVDFSPKNNFTHSAKTSPFELTGNYITA